MRRYPVTTRAIPKTEKLLIKRVLGFPRPDAEASVSAPVMGFTTMWSTTAAGIERVGTEVGFGVESVGRIEGVPVSVGDGSVGAGVVSVGAGVVSVGAGVVSVGAGVVSVGAGVVSVGTRVVGAKVAVAV